MAKASKKLVIALTDATRRAFSEVRDAHADERFYVFALFTETGDDLQPTCHSEEALERVVAKHRARKKRKSPPPDADALRFFAEEFEYHQAGEEHFEALEKISKRPGSDGLAAAVAALENLEREKFFGRGKARERVAVLVLMSDQSNGHLMDHARKLNPKRVVARLAKLFPERAATGKPTTIGKERVYSINGLSMSADRRCIAAAGGFGGDGVFVWSLAAKHALLFRNKVAKDSVWWVALSAKADVLYGKGKTNVLRWNLETKKEMAPLEVRGNEVSARWSRRRLGPWRIHRMASCSPTAAGRRRATTPPRASCCATRTSPSSRSYACWAMAAC
jgi:hypothetical protein